ncbi:MAG: radical SAM protein [Elusimicrobiota bacterium]
MQKKIVIITLYQYGAFGSMVLSDVLKSTNHSVFNIFFKKDKTNVMELPTEKEKKLLVDLIKDINPELIGISTRSTFFPVAKDITLKLRENVRSPIIWGGVHPTICPEECIQVADMICVGEGEKVVIELADGLANKQDTSKIKGLWLKKNGSVIQNEPQMLLQDLDELPLPSFDEKDTYSIENNCIQEGEPYYNDNLIHYNFMTGRGCPFHCNFCSNSILKNIFENKGPYIRQRTVQNVIEELKLAKKRFKKLRSVSSNDEIFVLNKEWLKEFCKQYKSEINLPFHCDIYPTFINEDIIKMLVDAGLRTITVGIQSGSEQIREHCYGRKTSEVELKKKAEILKKFHIFPSYDLIFDNPIETENDIKNTLLFMLGLPRPFRINMYSLQYHPKTQLTETFLQQKIILPDDIDGASVKGFNQWHVNFDSETQKQELVFLYKLFELLSSFINLSKKNPGRVISVFPRWLIRLIEKNNYFRKYPQLTNWIAFLPKLTFGLGLVFQCEFKRLWRSSRNFLQNTK